MTLLEAWCTGSVGVVLGVALLAFLGDLWTDLNDVYDFKVGMGLAGVFVFIALPVAVIVCAVAVPVQLYQDREHAGQVCVHSQAYTRYVKGVRYTGTECTVWGSPAPFTSTKANP